MNEQLSKNFSLDELTNTTHRELLVQNRLEAETTRSVQMNLHILANELLQPIRDYYKRPLRVLSGFRCDALNSAVGGSKASQHCLGEACDFIIPGVDLEDIFKWVKKESGLKYGQLILECYDKTLRTGWIHISSPRITGKNQEALTASRVGNKFHYDKVV